MHAFVYQPWCVNHGYSVGQLDLQEVQSGAGQVGDGGLRHGGARRLLLLAADRTDKWRQENEERFLDIIKRGANSLPSLFSIVAIVQQPVDE